MVCSVLCVLATKGCVLDLCLSAAMEDCESV